MTSVCLSTEVDTSASCSVEAFCCCCFFSDAPWFFRKEHSSLLSFGVSSINGARPLKELGFPLLSGICPHSISTIDMPLWDQLLLSKIFLLLSFWGLESLLSCMGWRKRPMGLIASIHRVWTHALLIFSLPHCIFHDTWCH